MSDTARPAAAAAPGFAFWVFCALTFVLIGRPQDYVAALVPLRLALVFTVLTGLVTIFRGGPPAAKLFSDRGTQLFFIFFAVMLGGIAFAVHRPGAFDAVMMRYSVNVAFFLLFIVHVDSVRKLRRVAAVLVGSMFLFTAFGLRNGAFDAGRFATGSLVFDPNDVAFIEVSLLGFALWTLVGSFGVLMKGLALASALGGALLTLYTASRGGLLGLLAFLLCFLAMRVPQVGKSFKAAMVVGLLSAALFNIDKINVERFMTLTTIENDYNFEEQGRADIWERGFKLFLADPITGVGVDGFAPAIGMMRSAEGNPRARWQSPHSAYVQVMTETGIFGTVAFVLLILHCLRSFNRIRRDAASFRDPELGLVAGLLLVGFVAQLVSATFLTQAYSMFMTLGFASAVALNRIASTSQHASPVAPVTVVDAGRDRIVHRAAGWSRR